MMPKLLMAGVMVGLVVSAVLALVKIVYYVITVVFFAQG